MRKWIKTRYPGVRYRQHSSRKHGIKFDQYYSIRYRVDCIQDDGDIVRKEKERLSRKKPYLR